MTAPEDEGEEVGQCECWWTLKDEFDDGERMEYADHGCPVHHKDDED